jgi:hypothetical protein
MIGVLAFNAIKAFKAARIKLLKGNYSHPPIKNFFILLAMIW